MFSEQRSRGTLLTTLLVFMLLMTNAGVAQAGTLAGPPPPPSGGQAGSAIDQTQPPADGTAPAESGYCPQITRFDRNEFPNPTLIDNQWTPLVPGTQMTFRGHTNQGGQPIPHTVVFIVTDLTKVIDGVRSVVSWDRDYQSDQLQESELVFNAQDEDRYVWNLGEYPEEYENGHFVGAPSTWISGIDRAKPGTLMLPVPHVGRPTYLQGYSPNIEFLDCGHIARTEQHVCLIGECFDHVLAIDETSPLDPESGIQRKFYAPGVGSIRITALGDPEGETLDLAGNVHLSPSALAEVHAQALALDRRGYRGSEVYRHTPPAR
jgi:hypothetical protein